MTDIYFVRHAQSDSKWTDDFSRPLTSAGAIDRLEVVAFFENKSISAMYSSPYIRALDTIRPLAENLKINIIKDIRLRERKTGPQAFSPKNLEKRWLDFSYSEPGGENLLSVQSRNIECLGEILLNEREKIVVVGTHGTALSTIWNYYDRSFGVEDFLEIIDLMPCIVKFSFENNHLVSVSKEFSIRKKYEGKNNLVEEMKKWKHNSLGTN